MVGVSEAFGAAVTHHQAGRLADAERAYREILAIDPFHGSALNNLSLIVSRDEAINLLRRAIEINPSYIDAQLNLAIALQASGDVDAAIHRLEIVLRHQPRNANAIFCLGTAHQVRGRDDEAIACFEQALRVAPDHVVCLCRLGDIFRGRGLIEEAITLYERALAVNPNYDKAQVGLKKAKAAKEFRAASALHQNKMINDAESGYKRALSLDPHHPAALNNLGLILYENRLDYEEAGGLFRQAISILPSYVDAHLNLGLVLNAQGMLSEAIACFEQALNIQPNFLAALVNLGATLASVGDSTRALDCSRRVLEMDPTNAIAHQNIGMIFEEQGRVDEALASFERAIYFKPDYIAALFSAGKIHERRGDRAKASGYFAVAKSLRPFYVERPAPPHTPAEAVSVGGRRRGAVLMTCPDIPYYQNMMRGFSGGFSEIGISCYTSVYRDRREELRDWIQRNDIRLVIEVNHVLDAEERSIWPEGIGHAVWIQDYRMSFGKKKLGDVGTSDTVYFLGHPKLVGVPTPTGRRWSVLLPGACSVAADDTDPQERRDFSITGYIPAPLDSATPVASRRDGSMVSVGEFLEAYPTHYTSHADAFIDAIHAGVANTCDRLGCELLPDAMELFDTTIPRSYERTSILKILTSISSSIDIYGPSSWKEWKEYAGFYRDYLHSAQDLNEVYRTTRVNIHNGALAMHFRVMDCMATGGFILINETPLDFDEWGIRRFLEPGRHYASYTMDTLAEVACRYLRDPNERRRIVTEAKQRIREAHLWRHRASQVAEDFGL